VSSQPGSEGKVVVDLVEHEWIEPAGTDGLQRGTYMFRYPRDCSDAQSLRSFPPTEIVVMIVFAWQFACE
jgi:hypothetical protein